MGLLNLASGNSFWRGYDYYKASMVVAVEQIAANRYQGTVKGSGKKVFLAVCNLRTTRAVFYTIKKSAEGAY